ncbi:GNAT family N-acetyltransferase [Cribrihabitans pelagius]|uniref:GNAT family N-acetyltransferase n=1 Tax=Cribrihabitans pelagius TaxID=1765746 RepID=UPI003B59F8F5
MSCAVTIRRYEAGDAAGWNAFVAAAKNGTFLHDRGFMEYHADRFTDHSLIAEMDGKTVALLPASRHGDELQSHGGLTYGGLVTGPAMSAALMLDVIKALGGALRSAGISCLRYKAIPHIFHRCPAEEDLYALMRAGARPVRSDLASVIAASRSPGFSKSKRQGARRAGKAGLRVVEMEDFTPFWEILTARLGEAHQAAPTHSLEEIRLLQSRFPDRIRLLAAVDDRGVQGGIVTFDCDPALHAQYMATTEDGRRNGALDLIVSDLADRGFGGRDWFSFGISTTDGGRELNTGLARQKEMFGARSIVFTHYEWHLG